MTGDIFCATRPAIIIRSDCRGDGRNTSAPKRAMSKREAPIDIISIAQQARPKVMGQIEFLRTQLTAMSSVVRTTPSGVGLPYFRSLTTRFPFSISTKGTKLTSVAIFTILNHRAGGRHRTWARASILKLGRVRVSGRSFRTFRSLPCTREPLGHPRVEMFDRLQHQPFQQTHA